MARSFKSQPGECPHSAENVHVNISPHTGSWAATCTNCGGHWLRTHKEVPVSVRLAAYTTAGIETVTAEEADELGFYVAKVGDPYFPPWTTPQGLRWIITPNNIQCGIYMPLVTSKMIDDFHDERTEFALTAGDHAFILGVRFGTAIDWQDGSWQAVLQPGQLPAGICEPEPGKHLSVHLVLVNSRTGLIAAMRVVTWPERFHRAVHKAVRSKIAHHSSLEAGMRELELWMDRYPDPYTLATRRADITCRGGAPSAHVHKPGRGADK